MTNEHNRAGNDLQARYDMLLAEYNHLLDDNSNSARRAKKLICELEEIKAEWESGLDELRAMRDECLQLSRTLKAMIAETQKNARRSMKRD